MKKIHQIFRCYNRLISKLEIPNFQHIQEDLKSHWYYVQIETFSTYKLNAIAVWGSTFKTERDKILILQKREIMLMNFNDVF